VAVWQWVFTIDYVHVGPAHAAQRDFEQHVARAKWRNRPPLHAQIACAVPHGA
jgi:hypothetical protein